eukprot:8569218-Pyramimonas_sp.AAC.1
MYGDCQVITGHVFSDGACRKYHYWPEASRAGWGFVQVGDHRILVCAYGALPGPVQTSPRAELYAVVQILRVAMLPTTIYTDYLDLPEGLSRGPSWGCSPRRPNSDLWCEIWRRIEDLGGLSSERQVFHVPGHQKGMSFEARGN